MINNDKIERFPKNFSPLRHDRVIFIVIVVIVAALVGDTAYARTSGLIFNTYFYSSIMPFILISIAVSIGQSIVLTFVRRKTEELQIKEETGLNRLGKILIVSQYVMVATLFIVIMQLLLASYYSTRVILLSMTISYSLAIFAMILLVKSFFSWFAANKSSLLFVYFLSAVILVAHLAFTLSFVGLSLLDMPSEMRTVVARVPYFPPGSITFILNGIRTVTSIIAFLMAWGASVVLLHHYVQKFGKMRYWILVSLPLAYFLLQFPSLLLNLFDPLYRANPIFLTILLTLLFQLSKPIGGLMFGIAFWVGARKIRQSAIVRRYITISAYGFILLFTSDQALSLISSQIPPFGLPTVSVIALSSYLILIGTYYTALSVSKDVKLRREVRSSIESKLPATLGSAQMNAEIQKTVSEVINRNQNSISATSDMPPSLEEDDLKQYLRDVMKERKKVNKENKS